jgi:opacity protein-like surface antigen
VRKVLVAVAAALVLPSGAQAADYLILYVNPTQVAPGWTLRGSVASGAFYHGSDDVFGLTLRRGFAAGRGEETHGLRAHHKQSTVSFAGRGGRWRTTGQLGATVRIDMTIRTTGAATPVTEALGCRGAFQRVPVRLQGTFSFRTGTKHFKTIRRTTLVGQVTRAAGAVDCSRPEPERCEPAYHSSSLYLGEPRAAATVTARSLSLQFMDVFPHGVFTWHHGMSFSGYDALVGSLPSFAVPAAAGSPIRGSATFAGVRSSDTIFGACTTTSTFGNVTGTLTTTFAGWGTRIARLETSDGVFRETS